MQVGFSIDPRQGLAEADELDLVRLGARLGYASAWTPAGPDEAAFDRCIAWHRASGLATGISVVPASGRPAAFYAEHARRAWEATGGAFVLGVGSGRMERPGEGMRRYLAELAQGLPHGLPVYVAALGPVMLRLAGELADGVALNWCSPEHVRWSRERVLAAAAAAGRTAPVVVSYIRTCVDPDAALARSTLSEAVLSYALGIPAYRRHFERMGFGAELRRLEEGGGDPSDRFLSSVGACGIPGAVRPRFQALAEGLDLAIVRVLVTRPGDAASARRALEECAPAAVEPSLP